MSIYKDALLQLLTYSDTSVRQREIITQALDKGASQDFMEEADAIALKYWNEYGKGPIDDKAYKALVTALGGVLAENAVKSEVKAFETVVDLLEHERKPLLIRRSVIADPTIAMNHRREISEIDRQVNEINLAIRVLKGEI